MSVSHSINYFVTLLMICSPLSALPALLALTKGRAEEEKKRTGIVSGIAVGIILIGSTWIGGPLLSFLGISIAAFRIAGGIVIFLLALSMLNAEQSRIKQTSEDQKEASHKESIAIVPLAIPIMAGPGAISTVIVSAGLNPGFLNQLVMTICALFVAATLGIVLYFASRIERVIGQNGVNIVNRIAGLLLASLAIEALASGLKTLFPSLG